MLANIEKPLFINEILEDMFWKKAGMKNLQMQKYMQSVKSFWKAEH